MMTPAPRLTVSKDQPLPGDSAKSNSLPILAGLLLFALGALLLAFFPKHLWITFLRWLGLLLLAYAGWRKRSLTFWIFFSMLLGLEIGLDWPQFAAHLRILSDIFLRLIKLIVAPLILGTLVTGIAGHGNIRKVGRIGLKAIVYFEAVTTIALFLGVAAINLTRAGVGLTLPAISSEQVPQNLPPLKWDDFLLHVFPENIVKAVGDNQVLQVAVFAILFGIALTLVPERTRQPMLSLAESLTQTMFRFTNIVMYYAPIGVGAAMAYTVGHLGINILLPLGKLVLTAYGALLTFLLCVLLPIGVPREIVAFVIPAGYSFNLDGSTLYLALASIFVAQAAGITMSWPQQLFMVFTLMLTSKGVAGVPRAVLVVLLATAGSLHLPTEPIFLILGVDALIDMARTSVNVTGNCLASAVVARWEGELSQPTSASR
jgi:proton glutamate symport protein